MYIKKWIKNIVLGGGGEDKPLTLHDRKAEIILEYAKREKCDAFLETGTYQGEMLWKMKEHFKWIGSVEIQKDLFENACAKFSEIQKIKLYCGDSAEKLADMITDIPNNLKILFWLDGHYSGGITGRADKDTPIMEEIKIINKYKKKNIVILIDDARCFTGKGEFHDYPRIKSFVKAVYRIWEDAKVEVGEDVIRITIN